jgi:hypothetical protein
MSAAPPTHQSAGARDAPHEHASTDPAILADADSSVTVHTMGVHYRWELPNTVRAQLRLAHDLREDLVTLQLAYADDVRAIGVPPAFRTADQIGSDPERTRGIGREIRKIQARVS